VQQAMKQAGRDSIEPTLAYTKQQDLEGRDQLREKGVEIFELDGLDAMRSRVAPIVETWSEKSPLIAEFVEVAEATR
jgi:C4-dicarboxylate-binding protein DctP